MRKQQQNGEIITEPVVNIHHSLQADLLLSQRWFYPVVLFFSDVAK